MADHGEVEYATADGNDYAEHETTYAMFLTLTKWMHRLPRDPAALDGLFPRLIVRCCSAPGGIMKVAIPAEADSEPRVAATPDTVKKLKALGADVVVQSGAGREVRRARCGLRGGRRDDRAERRRCGSRRRRGAEGAPPERGRARELQARRARDRDHGPVRQRGRARRDGQGRRRRLRHGADAAHHARAGDGRAVLAGEPRGLPRGDRRRRPNSAAPSR